MGPLRYIWIACALVLGLAALAPAAYAHAGHDHHGHRQHGAHPVRGEAPVIAVSTDGLMRVALSDRSSEILPASSGQAGHHGHAGCCVTGLGCPICAPVAMEFGLDAPTLWSRRVASPGDPAPPSVVIEAPPKPPRLV